LVADRLDPPGTVHPEGIALLIVYLFVIKLLWPMKKLTFLKIIGTNIWLMKSFIVCLG
jgi:hypothetical protein